MAHVDDDDDDSISNREIVLVSRHPHGGPSSCGGSGSIGWTCIPNLNACPMSRVPSVP